MIPWEMGKQLVWKVTVVDTLAPGRLNQDSLCNPGSTATFAEAREIRKYGELMDNGYIFQPVALEVQGSLGESSFLKQLISMALQIGNAACVLETVSDRNVFEEVYCIQLIFFERQYHCSFNRKFYRSTAMGGCKLVEFFWLEGQRSNLLLELQASNGVRSNLIEAFGPKTFFVCLKLIDYHYVGHMLWINGNLA